MPPPVEPAVRRPVADPFAAQNRRYAASSPAPATAPPANSIPDASVVGLATPPPTAPATSRYRQVATPVSAEQPAGPTLVAGDSNRSTGGRDLSAPDRTANRETPRYGTLTDSQEPAPFKVDPFAKPTGSAPAMKTERGTPDALAESSRAAETATDSEGTGQPGGQQLEGLQSPQLTIQKLAPKEIQVGKPAGFRVTVRNTGQIPAADVEICDLVPKGTRLLGTTPQASRGPHGEVVWAVGMIRPGEESTVEMQLLPMAEGEIGSVASVHFSAGASVRTIATRPQLVVQTVAPNKVLIGEHLTLTITVSNPGTGMATGVVLQEHIPPGLQHPAGGDLEYSVGNLKPGESRKLELPLVANRPGPTANLLTARGDGSLRAESKLDFEVLAPKLDVVMEGPKRRYLERQATYQLSVSNPGTAPAKQVELIASLPAGLKFVRANNAGYYEESTRTVRWRLEQLPPNETGSRRIGHDAGRGRSARHQASRHGPAGFDGREGAARADRRSRGHPLSSDRNDRPDRGGRRDDLRGPRGQSGLEGGGQRPAYYRFAAGTEAVGGRRPRAILSKAIAWCSRAWPNWPPRPTRPIGCASKPSSPAISAPASNCSRMTCRLRSRKKRARGCTPMNDARRW